MPQFVTSPNPDSYEVATVQEKFIERTNVGVA
jgi:hypothetical protein